MQNIEAGRDWHRGPAPGTLSQDDDPELSCDIQTLQACGDCCASEMPAYIRAAHSHARRTDPAFLLEIFETRTWARAYVAAELEMDFHEAVDGAWDAAVSYGLVDLLGADEIQRRMVVAFNAQRWS